MSRLVETGPGGRCVQMDASEIGATGGNFGGYGRVVDHWSMYPAADHDGRYQATAVVTGDEDVEPMYLVVVTSTDNAMVRDLQRAKLPMGMGIAVDAVVVLPRRVQTDNGARQVMRRLMMAAAHGDLPIVIGDLGYDRAAWTFMAFGIVAGLTTAHEAA